jgi:hypothetical protein
MRSSSQTSEEALEEHAGAVVAVYDALGLGE